jgi:hypothetical protein
MRKKLKNVLVLHKETLHAMAASRLGQAVGATSATYAISCATYGCDTFPTCYNDTCQTANCGLRR